MARGTNSQQETATDTETVTNDPRELELGWEDVATRMRNKSTPLYYIKLYHFKFYQQARILTEYNTASCCKGIH